MWSGGEDFNDTGETVRLYQPILYGRKPCQEDLTCSFIGGKTEEAPPNCGACHQPMHLLVQLFVPKVVNSDDGFVGKTIQVFACNRAACLNGIFADSPLCYGGGGVVVCRRRMATSTMDLDCDSKIESKTESSWIEEQSTPMDKDDWEELDNVGVLDSLESKLAAMETRKTTTTVKKKQKNVSTKKENSRGNTFSCYELSSLKEPPARRVEGMDEDDVGVGISGSDDKIQQMLARYMAEEDDEEILVALRGASGGERGSTSGGGRRERDERLSAQDRALFTYSDRLKRSPPQVLRYAFGGVPMWSIPTCNPQKQQKQKSKQNSNKQIVTEEPIPPCECGVPRVFELQLLPSILHVLDVDKYAENEAGGLQAAYSQGGMNWGNIAIYSCPKCSATSEYVVVQDSVDERPSQPKADRLTEAVVIAEGTCFDEEDEESDGDDEDCDEQDDDNNNNEGWLDNSNLCRG